MNNKLASIVLQKQRDIALLKQRMSDNKKHPIAQVLAGQLHYPSPCSFKDALQSSSLSIIAEIKRKSPSKGMIAPISDPVDLAQRYIAGGANALSILTDTVFFGGHIDDLSKVAKETKAYSIPILRKDFIIDPVQIAEAQVAGASAVLCIVAILGKKIKRLLEFAHSINMDVLVEIHDVDELQIALDSGAKMIGVNNRNLKTFDVDTDCALKIIDKIPSEIISVAESGITHFVLAQQYYQVGFDAVLIGEALVKSDNPKQFIEQCRHESSHH